ncbi:MAG TPA: hypothetical protein V6D06_00230, partial [Trichocoleus sp.]
FFLQIRSERLLSRLIVFDEQFLATFFYSNLRFNLPIFLRFSPLLRCFSRCFVHQSTFRIKQ